MKLPAVLPAVCATATFIPSAMGGFLTSGALQLSGSNFDFVGFEIVSSGDSFQDPALSDFQEFGVPAAGWGLAGDYGPSATRAGITGPELSDLVFTLNFDSDSSDLIANPITFDLFAYDAGSEDAFFSARINFDGNLFDFFTGSAPNADPGRSSFATAVIPLPSAGLMAAAGLGVLGVHRRR